MGLSGSRPISGILAVSFLFLASFALPSPAVPPVTVEPAPTVEAKPVAPPVPPVPPAAATLPALAPLPDLAGKPYADILPEGTILLIDAPDISATRARLQSTLFCQIVSHPQLKEYLEPLADKIDAFFKQADAYLKENAKLSLDDLDKSLNGHVAFALTDVGMGFQRGPDFKAVLLVTPKDPAAFKAILDRFIASLPEGAKAMIATRQAFGVEISEFAATGPQGPPFNWALAGDTFIIGLGVQATDGVLERIKLGGRGLSADPDFSVMREKLAAVNQDWMYYISFARIMTLIKATGGDDAANFLNVTGVGDLRAVGAAAKLNGPAIDDTLFVLFTGGAKPGRLQSVLSTTPLTADLLDMVPAEADSVAVSWFNVPFAYSTFVDVVKGISPTSFQDYSNSLAEADKALGLSLEDDLFKAMGDQVLMYNILPSPDDVRKRLAAVPEGKDKERTLMAVEYEPSVVVFKVRDAARIRKSLRLFGEAAFREFAGAVNAAEPPVIPHFVDQDYKGVQLRLLQGITYLPLVPGYAVTDKYAILAGSEATLKSAVDLALAPPAVPPASPILDAARAEIAKGAGSVFVSETNKALRLSGIAGKDVYLPQLAEFLSSDETPDPAIEAMLRVDPTPAVEAAVKPVDLICTYVVKSDRDGVAVTTHSPTGMGSIILPAIAASAVITPLAMNARENTLATRCLVHVQQIAKALELYRAEHGGDLPDSLADLVPEYIVNPAVLRCPGTRNRAQPPGAPPIDYDYVGRLPAGVAAPDTIILCDKMGNHMRTAHYMTFDLHVTTISAWQLWDVLHKSYDVIRPWVEQQPKEVQTRIRTFYQTGP